MSAFTGPLTMTEAHVDSDVWRMVTPLVFEVGTIGSGVFIIAEAGFESDGASIPWPVRIVFPRWGRKYRRPAVIHDKCCVMLNAGAPLPEAPTRAAADRVFLEAMAVAGVAPPVRLLFFAAVRLFALIRGKR